jgi:putative FmdB family regulatory protein
MPTYEYRCKDCGNDLEVQQAFTDDPLTECPSCGGSLKKKFGSVGISFKGSGFYKNDSRGGSSTTTPATASASESTSGSSDSSSSSDTKTTTSTPAPAPASTSTKTESSKPSTPSSAPAST